MMSRFRCVYWLLLIISFVIYAQIDPTPARWCNRETPVENGVFKLEPPYWQYPGCPNLPFDTNATQKCMAGRTLYVMGNSVGRQSAFGMVELLGGANVKREDQRDMCPKHETTWDDSCHQEFANVKIRYLFMQFVDGFNYTDRNGAPFWKKRITTTNKDGKNVTTIKTGRLGNGKGNTPGNFVFLCFCVLYFR